MTLKTNRYKLPQPVDEKDGDEWVSIPRVSRVVPFGYKVRDDDPFIMDPIPLELDLLEEAKKFMKQYNHREVAAWLSNSTGRYISNRGLVGRIEQEKRNKSKAASYRKWAEYAEKAIAAAEKLEKERTGAKGPHTSEDS